MRARWFGVLAVMGGLALGAACEQNGPRSSSERGSTTSTPSSRSPSGERASDRSAGPAQSTGSAAGLTPDRGMGGSGTGGAGDAGMGADAGTRMR